MEFMMPAQYGHFGSYHSSYQSSQWPMAGLGLNGTTNCVLQATWTSTHLQNSSKSWPRRAHSHRVMRHLTRRARR